MRLDEERPIRVTCAPGVGAYLRAELEGMGYAVTEAAPMHVQTRGTLLDAMRLNLHLRTALHVLYLLAEFRCTGPEDLYDGTADIAWEEIVPADEYVCVASRVDHPSMTSWSFANLKVKDAIVDRMTQRTGGRPLSGPEQDHVVVAVYWHGDRCKVFLDASGNKLSDRGYRRRPGKAPMQETLAAAVLMAAGYDGSQAFINPMCGSGTLAIEAALIAMRRATGLLRANYGILHVRGFDTEAWESVRREAGKGRRKEQPAKIIASDIDDRAIEAAEANARTAGVDHQIEFHTCDFTEAEFPEGGGFVMLNPPYGERMGEKAELERLYERIGDFFKQRCAGHTGYVFTGNRELAKRIGLRASRRMEFWNAKIECRLLKYELYTGTRRKDRPIEADGL